MTEEGSNEYMETDVSSTTSDVPSKKVEQESTREVVVVVEKLNDEEIPSYEASTTNDRRQPSSDSSDRVKKTLECIQKAISAAIEKPEIILIDDSPEKITEENKESVDSTSISPQKSVLDLNTLKKLIPLDLVQEQEPINRSPKKVELSHNTVSVTPTKISPIKIQLTEECTGNKDIQKSPSKYDHKTAQESPVKLLELPKSPQTKTKTPTKDAVQDEKEIASCNIPENNIQVEIEEKEGKNVSDTIESESVDENDTISLTGMVCDTLNDSLLANNSDATDKDHNKKVNRELKSLMNSAKESKIINECTQLTTKMRKSRGLGNTSLDNSGVNSPISPLEATRLHSRRGSTNSQRSTSSEVSEKIAIKRSMRSQNPEFVNKVKLFLNSVTGKGQKDDEPINSEDEMDSSHNKSKSKSSMKDAGLSLSKKKKTAEGTSNTNMLQSDPYCWRCHWLLETDSPKAHEPVKCISCPRSFHYKCVSVAERSKTTDYTSWVCPECLIIQNAKSSETKSSTLKNLSPGKLFDLLSNVIENMMQLKGVEPFLQPVDCKAFPDYNKYVVHPMDLSLMKQNVTAGVYTCTDAFAADAQWILHNSIIFNTLQSKLTGVARALLRSCRAHLSEIEACFECYAAALERPDWFTEVCSTPHILLWAKLKGFPFWPAKCMSVGSAGLVHVRFFGAHDRAWVHNKDCFLYCENDPNNMRTKRQDLITSMEEAEQYIRSISRKYGSFVYPPFKTPFDCSKMTEQLKMMIPSFKGEITMRPKESFPSSPSVRTKSKSRSKDFSFNECDTSESDYCLGTHSNKNGKEETPEKEESNKKTYIAEKENEHMDVDNVKVENTDVVDSTQVTEDTRKRRYSHLEEAVLTVIESKTVTETKRKRAAPETNTNTVEVISLDDEDSLAENNKKNNKNDDKVEITRLSVTDVQSNSKKGSATPKTNKEAPKVEKTSTKDKSTSKEKDASKTVKQLKDRRPKFKIRIKEKGHAVKKSKRSSSKGKKTEIKADQAQNKVADKTKVDIDKDGKFDALTSTLKTITPKSYSPNTSKSVKNRLAFDDDTSLAVIAREVAKNNIVNVPGLPTISNIRSLSAEGTSKKGISSTQNKNFIEVTVESNSETSVFTPTSSIVDNTRTNDAANRLKTLIFDANKTPTVGQIGVKAFARMSASPVRQSQEDVEVEVKTEPIDYDDDRQTDKMTLMNVFKLRPVNPSNKGNLRDIRINKVVSGPPAKKLPVSENVKPRARKTFPQPRKLDEVSGLNCKNSMVYIPIQPPITQAPVRAPKSHTVTSTSSVGNSILTTTVMGAPSSSQSIIIPDTVVTSTANNNTLNVVTTSLLPSLSNSTSMLPILPTMPTVPTVGQVPTNVHTVPLITSVNGQWTFSLQPVMSVGGLDSSRSSANAPIVNGIGDRPATILSPLASITPNPSASVSSILQKNIDTTATATIDLTEPQGPQPRVLSHPLDPNSPAGPVPPPSSAGPATAKLNQSAVKLADFFRDLLEESFVLTDEPQAKLASIKLQLERERWKHKQELDEVKHNHELTMNEMRASFEKEKNRIALQIRSTAQTELENAVNNAKSKQWCVYCKSEAQFYCCWNTSYCDYRCQRAHWPAHHSQCAQQRPDGGSNGPVDRDGNSSENGPNSQSEKLPALQRRNLKVVKTGATTRLVSEPPPPQQKSSSFIVSMVEDQSGKQTVKCVGAYKAGGSANSAPLLINKQILNSDEAKKVVTSGGYLIVGAGGANSSVDNPRRTQTIQYLQK